jgi:hypothetical protein
MGQLLLLTAMLQNHRAAPCALRNFHDPSFASTKRQPQNHSRLSVEEITEDLRERPDRSSAVYIATRPARLFETARCSRDMEAPQMKVRSYEAVAPRPVGCAPNTLQCQSSLANTQSQFSTYASAQLRISCSPSRMRKQNLRQTSTVSGLVYIHGAVANSVSQATASLLT